MNSKAKAKAVYVVSYIAALAVAWQAVRFCQGSIGAPVLDQFMSALGMTFGAPAQPGDVAATFQGVAAFFDWYYKAIYYLGGVTVWLFLAQLTRSAGWTFGRIVEVGFAQYREEVKEAQRLAAIEDARDRRRERRREARRRDIEAKRPKSGFSLTTLAIGIVIGSLF